MRWACVGEMSGQRTARTEDIQVLEIVHEITTAGV